MTIDCTTCPFDECDETRCGAVSSDESDPDDDLTSRNDLYREIADYYYSER